MANKLHEGQAVQAILLPGPNGGWINATPGRPMKISMEAGPYSLLPWVHYAADKSIAEGEQLYNYEHLTAIQLKLGEPDGSK